MTEPGFEPLPLVGWWAQRDVYAFSGVGELVLTGYPPTVTASTSRQPGAGALTLTGSPPTVNVSTPMIVTPGTGALTLAGSPPSVLVQAPIGFDATGAGSKGSGTSRSWSHTAAANATVIASISTQSIDTISSITYGGNAMTLIGSQAKNNDPANGAVHMYKYVDTTGGTRTIAVTVSTGYFCVANSTSYLRVNTVGTAQKVYGTGSSLSQGITVGSSQWAVQAFAGVSSITPSGGTNRYSEVSAASSSLTISDASTTTTFTGSMTSNTWAGVGAILS